MAGFGFGNVGFVGSLGGGGGVVVVPQIAPAGIMADPDFNAPFSTASWERTGTQTITGGRAVFNGNVDSFFYQVASNYAPAAVVGASYRLAFLINPGATGSLRAVFNNTALLDVLVSGPGLKEFVLTYTGGSLTFNFQDKGFNGSIEWCQLSPV